MQKYEMQLIVETFALTAGIIVLIQALFLGVEVFGAFLPRRRREIPRAPANIVVVIPAHNEAASITATVASVKPQLRNQDRIIVIADNCSDTTAELAIAAGAECLLRSNATQRGKGYALQFGLDHLKAAPPDIVIFVDADCLVEDGALLKLAAVAHQQQRPVQALYLMKAPAGASARLRVAEFTWTFMNHVRMRGLDRIFGVSRITGAGISIPWPIAAAIHIGSGEIVEDLALTLDFAGRRAPPVLLLDALVTSEFPTSDDALAKQRARWEHGSRQLALRSGIPSLLRGIVTANIHLAAIAMDILIPPLTILLVLIGAAILLGMGSLALGAYFPLVLSLTAMLIAGISVIAGWRKFGADALPVSELGGVARFLAAKLRIYSPEGFRSAKTWTPTRGNDEDNKSGK